MKPSQEIIEARKKIMKFMGIEPTRIKEGGFTSDLIPGHILCFMDTYEEAIYRIAASLGYDQLFSLIMPVIEKIDNTHVLNAPKDQPCYLYCVSLNGNVGEVTDSSTGKVVASVKSTDGWDDLESDSVWTKTAFLLAVKFIDYYNSALEPKKELKTTSGKMIIARFGFEDNSVSLEEYRDPNFIPTPGSPYLVRYEDEDGRECDEDGNYLD